jgi:hypothetical protein
MNEVASMRDMMIDRWKYVATLLLAGGALACGSNQGDQGVVARVGSYTLTIDEMVDLLADEERLAADAGVVESLAQLWIDYTLLAEAAARDTMFSGLDLEPLVMQQVTQQMVFQLRDSVIQVDTFVTDDELRDRYESDPPRMEVRARHIMMQLPIGATQAQRDSVRTALGDVRDRLEAGASFEDVARRVSQDPGTAASGGDLGYFQRGEMVAPFEQAAFALEEGEISDVVQTPMGFHLIRVEDRRVRDFGEVSAQYRREVQGRMVQEAESVFVTALVDDASPELQEGARDVVREIAASPRAELSGRARRRALVGWAGGEITVGDVQQVLRIESAALRNQLAAASDEAIDDFLESLARRDLLVRHAESEGLRPPRDSIDALADDARAQLRSAARRLGLLDLDRAPGEDLEVAVSRAVEEALADNLSGATQVVPLGLVGFQLRDGRATTVAEAAVGQVIIDVAAIRANRSLSPVEEAIGAGAPLDSTAR